LKLERIPWRASDAPGEQTLRRTLEDEGFEVVTWRDRCNWTYEPHAHEHDESLWVLRGRIVLKVAGEDISLGPGDRLMLPKEVVHTADVGPDGAVYLIGQKR
jgi:mannose-6-phosphate isomerase-like protein (cupin superfamily)